MTTRATERQVHLQFIYDARAASIYTTLEAILANEL
jgi:hypothetical protein